MWTKGCEVCVCVCVCVCWQGGERLSLEAHTEEDCALISCRHIVAGRNFQMHRNQSLLKIPDLSLWHRDSKTHNEGWRLTTQDPCGTSSHWPEPAGCHGISTSHPLFVSVISAWWEFVISLDCYCPAGVSPHQPKPLAYFSGSSKALLCNDKTYINKA